MKAIEQRVEKQSLDVSISSINEKISKTVNKLRETSKFLDSLYGNVEMLNKNFEEMKNIKEFIQEIDDNLTSAKSKFNKEIETVKSWFEEKLREPNSNMKNVANISDNEIESIK